MSLCRCLEEVNFNLLNELSMCLLLLTVESLSLSLISIITLEATEKKKRKEILNNFSLHLWEKTKVYRRNIWYHYPQNRTAALSKPILKVHLYVYAFCRRLYPKPFTLISQVGQGGLAHGPLLQVVPFMPECRDFNPGYSWERWIFITTSSSP